MSAAQSFDRNASPAFQFGWQCYLQRDLSTATDRIAFETVKSELERLWNRQNAPDKQQLPWEVARESARDAWNQVQEAMMNGSQAKPSAR